MLLNMLVFISFWGASLYFVTICIKRSYRKGLQKYKNSDDQNKASLKTYALVRGTVLAGSIITVVTMAIIICLLIIF